PRRGQLAPLALGVLGGAGLACPERYRGSHRGRCAHEQRGSGPAEGIDRGRAGFCRGGARAFGVVYRRRGQVRALGNAQTGVGGRTISTTTGPGAVVTDERSADQSRISSSAVSAEIGRTAKGSSEMSK